MKTAGVQKVQPAKQELSEKERAEAKREKLLKLQASQNVQVDDSPNEPANKREAKMQSKA